MIRIPINLASEPFEHTRAPRFLLIVGCSVLTVLLLGQVAFIVARRGQAAAERTQIASINQQLAGIASKQAVLQATLQRPENAEVLHQSVFLNALIERKAISWTRLFKDLEDVMPHNTRLISVRLPQIDSHNRVLLDMVVGASEPAPVLELLKQLEVSPRFGPASVYNIAPATQTEPLLRYRISVNYAQKL
jgi:type IV pilus assembly protein PilN